MDIKNGEFDATLNPTGSKVSYKLWKNREAGQFSVRNLNMYFDFKYGSNLRAFSEIKYMDYPSGSMKLLGDPTVTDDGNGSFIGHGSIYIERAWLDYKINDFFKLQFGKMLTPFGIWNVEHGAPVLPSIRVPASISYGFVPNSFVGLNIHGNRLLKNWEFEYNAFVSNGRGIWNMENNENKGIGVSVNFKAPTKFLNKLVFGGMYYTGKEVLDIKQGYFNDTTSNIDYQTFTNYNVIQNSAKEYCYTLHFATGYKKIELNAEYVYNNIDYENYNAIDNLNNRLFYRPNNNELIRGVGNGYVLLRNGNLATTKNGYSLPLNKLNPERKGYYVMARYLLSPKFYPYFTYEAADPGDNDVFPPVKIYIIGLNYKPLPVVTFKIEHSWQKFDNEPLYTGYSSAVPGLLPNALISKVADKRVEDFNYFQMSVSYAF